MEYLEFTESIRKSVSDQLGNDKKVTIREVLKNNGIRLKGLLIASKDHSASPTIYLERFYDRYLHGDPMEEITETEPGFKGDTATGATKPATVETGALVYVPLFVEQGDKIKIDTRTGEYLSRV